MKTFPEAVAPELIMNRRTALKRTAALLGVSLTPALVRALAEMDRSSLSMGGDWKPRNLTEQQAEVLDHVTELIIPRTETVGARDVGVAPFIDFLCQDYMGAAAKSSLIAGLDKWAQAGFARKSETEQTRMMEDLIEHGTPTDRQWLTRIRSLALSAYFTSEEAVKTVLVYDPIPGRYRGCVPIAETGNVLRTNG